MKRLTRIRAGYIICLLFAAVAALEFVRTRNWVTLAYFGVLALVFLLLDSGKKSVAQS